MPGYLQQDTDQTLSEGVAEYHATNPAMARPDGAAEAAQAFFRCHDAAHVVFGCDVNLLDELTVKIYSLFGTSAGLGVLKGYRLPESKEIYERLSLAAIFVTVLKSFVVVPLTIFRCIGMKRRWPWKDFDVHWNTPLSEIRDFYGIRVPHRK